MEKKHVLQTEDTSGIDTSDGNGLSTTIKRLSSIEDVLATAAGTHVMSAGFVQNKVNVVTSTDVDTVHIHAEGY